MTTKPRMITLAALVVVSSLARKTLATELLPGQTVALSALPQGTVTFNYPSPSIVGNVNYQQPNVGTQLQFALYNSIVSYVTTDANGHSELLYSFSQPGGLQDYPPPSPDSPILNFVPFPADARLSIAGFGNAPVDVRFLPAELPSSSNTVRIQRSLSGDVMTLTGFTPTSADRSFIAIIVPGETFGPSTATVSLTDLEGQPRTLTANVLAPIPEPTSLALLPLAMIALASRLRSRTN